VAAIRYAAENKEEYAALFSRFQTYFSSPFDVYKANISSLESLVSGEDVPMASYSIRMHRQPVYLLGRCRLICL
jgi:ABC-type metal ion transport system substrate-binding protein